MLPKLRHSKRILTFLTQNPFEWIFPVALFSITLLICILNFTPGTWLTGWDTLHPEFDFFLNFKRMINGAWRTDQGLGAVAAHSHMSELPRLLILWILSLIAPTEVLRYGYIFTCFILGPLGIYVFARFILHTSKQKNIPSLINLAAFIAGLTYIFNLATVQQFIVVFEMFAVQYAALGWLFWTGTQALTSPQSKKWLLAFFIVSILSAPMAYASTLWLATMGGLGLYLIGITVLSRSKKVFIKLFQIGLVLFAANSFWLLPNLYFLLSPAHSIPEKSHINQLFSQEAFLQNQEFGTFFDLALLKNFLFQWQIYDFEQSEFVMLLQPWIDHISQQAVQSIGYFFALTAILGCVLATARKQTKIIPLLLPFCLSIFMLINANPPFTTMFEWLRTHSGLFEEGFRFPFTKFSFLYVFCFSLFIASATHSVLNVFKKYRELYSVVWSVILISTSVSLIYLGWPMFQGKLISQHIRKPIPTEYESLFQFMNQQPAHARVALLPAATPAGWEYKNWGYQGAGFLWFGMSQPILVRDFDRWNSHNETFYEKLSTAIYGKDDQALDQTLRQYQVPYLLVDEYSINAVPGDTKQELNFKDIYAQLDRLEYQQVWQQNGLKLYQTSAPIQLPITTNQNPDTVLGSTKAMRQDPLYQQYQGGYIEHASTTTDGLTIFPFANLTSAQTNNLEIKTQNGQTQFVTLSAQLPSNQQGWKLEIPELVPGSMYTSLVEAELIKGVLRVDFLSQNTLEYGSQVITLPQLPPITIDVSASLEHAIVHIGKTNTDIPLNTKKVFPVTLTVGQPIAIDVFDAKKPLKIDLSTQFQTNQMEKCYEGNSATAFASVSKNGGITKIRSKDTSLCQSMGLLTSKDTSYVAQVKLPFLSEKFANPYFCLVSEKNQYNCLNNPEYNRGTTQSTWSTITDTILLPPNDSFWLDLKVLAHPDPQTEQIISYQVPTVSLFPLTTSKQVPVSVWAELQKPPPLTLKPSDQPQLKLNILASTVDLLRDNKTVSYFQNCQPEKQGTATETIDKSGAILFESENNAVGCKAFYLDDISQQAPHLILVEGENKTGRGLKLYLYNQSSDHIDLEEMLPNGKFRTALSVLNWKNLDDAGYTLSLENRAFGRLKSQNQLQTLKTFTLPLDWISQMRIHSLNEKPPFSEVEIVAMKKVFTHSYLVTINKSQLDKPAFISLSQSFDQGWIAFNTTKPFELLEHVQYNGWANAWIIDGAQTQNIVVLYWPQLLEFLGLGLATGCFIVIVLANKKKLAQK